MSRNDLLLEVFGMEVANRCEKCSITDDEMDLCDWHTERAERDISEASLALKRSEVNTHQLRQRDL